MADDLDEVLVMEELGLPELEENYITFYYPNTYGTVSYLKARREEWRKAYDYYEYRQGFKNALKEYISEEDYRSITAAHDVENHNGLIRHIEEVIQNSNKDGGK